jgi:GNAT superfamily N-acetyltransferase
MIRELTENDLDDVIVLLRQLSPIAVDPDRPVLRAKILEIAHCGHMKVFGYEDGGRIAGMCTVGRIEGLSKGCRPFAVIENVVVHEAARRQGIGTKLVCHAVDQAEEWGCYKVVLETGTRNEGKLRFYEKCGLVRGDKTAFIKRFQ